MSTRTTWRVSLITIGPRNPMVFAIGLFKSALFQQHKFRAFSDVTSRTILTQFQVRQGQCYWNMFITNRRCLDNSYPEQVWILFISNVDALSQDLCWLWTELHEIWLISHKRPTWLSHTEISHREWTLQACVCCIISGSTNKGAVCLYFTEWVLLALLWVYRVVASDIQSSLLWTFDYSSLDPLSGSCISEHWARTNSAQGILPYNRHSFSYQTFCFVYWVMCCANLKHYVIVICSIHFVTWLFGQ